MSQEPGPEVQGVPVTARNWQDPPVNRWAYWHIGDILPTYRVPRGDGRARDLPAAPAVGGRPSTTGPRATGPPTGPPRTGSACSRSR